MVFQLVSSCPIVQFNESLFRSGSLVVWIQKSLLFFYMQKKKIAKTQRRVVQMLMTKMVKQLVQNPRGIREGWS